MYTEFVLGVDLKNDTPRKVIDILYYMIYHEVGETILDLPHHPLFKTDRWYRMLMSDSFSFGGCSIVRLEKPRHQYDDWHLSIRCSLRNYCNEIEFFLNWLLPYIDSRGFIGYMLYEEFDIPYLIYINYEDDLSIHLYRMEELVEAAVLNERWINDHIR